MVHHAVEDGADSDAETEEERVDDGVDHADRAGNDVLALEFERCAKDHETRENESDTGLGHGTEAEDLLAIAAADRAKSASEEAGDDSSTDFEHVGDELVTRGDDQLQPTDNATQQKAEWKIDRAGVKGEWSNCGRRETVHRHSGPTSELVLSSHDGFQARCGFVYANTIMNNILVDLVDVAKLSKIDTLGSPD